MRASRGGEHHGLHGGSHWALCLTDPKYAKENGTQLILATCRDTSDQHWSVP